jgi:hypothetical protein
MLAGYGRQESIAEKGLLIRGAVPVLTGTRDPNTIEQVPGTCSLTYALHKLTRTRCLTRPALGQRDL